MNKLKHIYYFLLWWYRQANKIDLWFTVILWNVIGGGFITAVFHNMIGYIMLSIGLIGLVGSAVFSILVYPIIISYRKFKREQHKLLDQFKD